MEIAREVAASNGCEVIESNDRTLQLDLDSEASVEQAVRCWPLFLEALGAHGNVIVSVRAWTSRHGRVHVEIVLAAGMTTDLRLAMQAALGSDPKREILSITRLGHGMVTPSLLFRPRGAEVRVAEDTNQYAFEVLVREAGLGMDN